MLNAFEEILCAALSLPPEERATLADHLLSSLDGPDQEEIDAPGRSRLRNETAKSMKARLS